MCHGERICQKRPVYCSKLTIFTYSCHCENFVMIGELYFSYRKIDTYHSDDGFDRKLSANLSSLFVFGLLFLNSLSYCARSSLFDPHFKSCSNAVIQKSITAIVLKRNVSHRRISFYFPRSEEQYFLQKSSICHHCDSCRCIDFWN